MSPFPRGALLSFATWIIVLFARVDHVTCGMYASAIILRLHFRVEFRFTVVVQAIMPIYHAHFLVMPCTTRSFLTLMLSSVNVIVSVS